MRTLLIDDETHTLNHHIDALVKNGHSVKVVNNYLDACKELQAKLQWYDVVILDMLMPGADPTVPGGLGGIDIFQEIHLLNASSFKVATKKSLVPVAILSHVGVDLFEDRLEGIRTEMHDNGEPLGHYRIWAKDAGGIAFCEELEAWIEELRGEFKVKGWFGFFRGRH